MNNVENEQYARFSSTVLKQKNIDTFVSQEVLRVARSKREYQFGGVWTGTNLGQKPDATRVVVGLEAFRKARDVYFAWQDISPFFAFDPVFPESIIKRLMEQEKPTLFIPWGVRNTPYFGGKEREAMDQIDMVKKILQKRNIEPIIRLMPADLYALEVNSKLKPENVMSYFDQVKKEGEKRGYTVTPWSQIRWDNQEAYTALSSQFTDDILQETLPNTVIENATRAAKKNSGFTEENEIESAAFRYLRERICEATIVESLWQPVKLSMAPKNKDNVVDMELPRLYVLPDYLVLPWKG